jgi:methionine sulfoxide reductase heme-binding subunit
MARGGTGLNVLASSPSPYWYLTRSAGSVALLLLTASVVLGVLDVSRWRTDRWPRFVTDALHRNVSLLAVAFVALHVVTSVADSFAPIGLKDSIIPFASPYRPLWLGLGALAFDVLLAVAITSMVRRRIGFRAWRGIHWAAYASWPLALVHGLGTGTDTPSAWMLLITAACILAAVVAIGWRIGTAPPASAPRRLGAGGLAAGLIALVVWMASGPLARNWAARAGTPPSLLAAVHSSAGPAITSNASSLQAPFTAQLNGTLHQSASSETGLAIIDLRLTMSRGASGSFAIRIEGQPVGDGGVAMSRSTVSLGPPGQSHLYGGRIVALRGSRMVAVASSSDGGSVRLDVNVSIDQATGSVSGTVRAQPGAGGGGTE